MDNIDKIIPLLQYLKGRGDLIGLFTFALYLMWKYGRYVILGYTELVVWIRNKNQNDADLKENDKKLVNLIELLIDNQKETNSLLKNMITKDDFIQLQRLILNSTFGISDKPQEVSNG